MLKLKNNFLINFMLDNSKDLLFIVFAFCALWLSAFISWAIYYVVKILKKTAESMNKIDVIVNKLESAFVALEESLFKVKEHVDKIVEMVQVWNGTVGKWFAKKNKKESIDQAE